MQVDSYLSPATVKGSLSIDRVSFLVFSPYLSLWGANEGECRENERRIAKLSDLTEKVLKGRLDEDFPQGIPTELFKHHYRTSGEVDVQFGAKMPKRKVKSEEDLIDQYGTIEVDDSKKYYNIPSNYGFRVEYNPNNTNLSSVSELLESISKIGHAGYIRIARLDIAIDFKASIVPELVLCHGMRKSFSASGTKGLESVYFGTRRSTNYIRLYDKRQEQIDKKQIDIGHDLWRLELESKQSFCLNESAPDHGKVFQRFTFYDGAVSSGDWIIDLLREQAMIIGLQNVLRRLPKATATRYRKKFKEMVFGQNIETPDFIYYRDFPREFENVRGHILKTCGFKLTG